MESNYKDGPVGHKKNQVRSLSYARLLNYRFTILRVYLNFNL